MENKRAEHWCTLQNHFAIGGVKTKMSSPSVVRETRGTASTVSNHARTSADNGLPKIASGNQKCRSTIFDATPHAVHLAVRPVLRFFERKTKQKAKTWKSAFSRGRAKVALCSAACPAPLCDGQTKSKNVERRIPTLGDTGSHS